MSSEYLPLPSTLRGERWDRCTVGMDGDEVSRQESKEALSYADYLPVYYKSFAKYQDSDMNQRIISAECLPPHLKLHIIHQKLQRSPLQNGADSRVAISLGLMLFRKPPGLCRPCWAFKLWSRNIYYQLRLLLIDISAILHLKRSSIFTGTPSFTARLRREFKLNHAAPSCLSVMSWNEAPVHSEKLRISPLPEGDINLFSAEHKHMFRVHANVLSSCIASG